MGASAAGALLCLGWLSVGAAATASTAFSAATGVAGLRTSGAAEGMLLSAGCATFTATGAALDGWASRAGSLRTTGFAASGAPAASSRSSSSSACACTESRFVPFGAASS